MNTPLEGIYPDLLHICDLAIYFDNYSSSLLHWTDGSEIFEGKGRDERLLAVYKKYLAWCIQNRCWVLENDILMFGWLVVHGTVGT